MTTTSNNKKLSELLDSLRNSDKIRVLFVCLGNICRSPAADGIMHAVVERHGAETRWEIDSAGTGGWHVGDLPDERMRAHGRRRGYDFRHVCRQVRTSDFDNYDLIIGMDDNNVSNLRCMAPTLEDAAKVVPMATFLDSRRYYAVPDPYYEGAEGFELVLDLLEQGCENLYNRLS